ncbi:lasso RiPP family leader peptide-containing protein [Micromonospora sp. NBC_01813]|uniref:lasso RiPP family leader peptide-containing protein n=1 Tax=Micromonospora sp. NBC_01813 TaxID=2975988 RepID=UPI002DDBBC4C|nr:lasso RiPP family leader peptide-containing protein [Micromonospora sp. NBC_01813]WSA11395.1 lasso RiPP family leader peptide-containing protein [Micromonospora sp. NBC_01813]
MSIPRVSTRVEKSSPDYRPPRLRRLGTLAELTKGGFPGVTDADGQSGVEGSI